FPAFRLSFNRKELRPSSAFPLFALIASSQTPSPRSKLCPVAQGRISGPEAFPEEQARINPRLHSAVRLSPCLESALARFIARKPFRMNRSEFRNHNSFRIRSSEPGGVAPLQKNVSMPPA